MKRRKLLSFFRIRKVRLVGCIPGVFCFLFLFSEASAQEFVGKAGSNGFTWRLIGRVFFDGGFFIDDSVRNSFQVNDIRLGGQFRFLDHWEAKIELGYGDSKVSLKDVYVNYAFGEHSVRLGHYYEPFGNARAGTTNFRFLTNAPSDRALGNKRKLGISYSYNHKWFNFMGGVFSEGDIEKSKPVDQGYSLAAKFVGRPYMADKRLVHIGVAPRFSSGQKVVNFTGGIPTDLLSKSENAYVDAEIDQVINQWKLDLELILLYDKFYCQGQYFLAHLNLFGTSDYKAEGGYVQVGYMILGAGHNYNPKTGMIVNPAPKSLEFLFRYDLLNLNDGWIQGGKLSDVTVGMNYFINKYIAAKINYTYLILESYPSEKTDNFGLIQARLQFAF